MRHSPWIHGIVAIVVAAALGTASAGPDVYGALGVETKDVLSGTILRGRVVPGGGKQVVCVVTYLTGSKDPARAVNIRLGVFDELGGELVSLYKRDFGNERGGHVSDGDLQLIDLDVDRLSEIVVSYDSFADPLVKQSPAEVIVHEAGEFRTAWSGLFKYDATQAARTVPRERQDRYAREINLEATMRTRGAALVTRKRMLAVAGERLAEPREIEESFPFRDPSGATR